jgi:hypothetical protein
VRINRGEMTKAELLEILEQFPDEAVIRLATQRSYPFEHGICSVEGFIREDLTEEQIEDLKAELPGFDDGLERMEAETLDIEDDVPGVIYLYEGGQRRYLPADIASATDW